MVHKPLVLSVLVISLQSRREKYESTERCAQSILKNKLWSDVEKTFAMEGGIMGGGILSHHFFTVLEFEPSTHTHGKTRVLLLPNL